LEEDFEDEDFEFEDELDGRIFASSLLVGATPTFLKPPNLAWMKRAGGMSSPVELDELDRAMEWLEDNLVFMVGRLPLVFELPGTGWEAELWFISLLRAKNWSKGMEAPSLKFGELEVSAR
jgi:hypothetical protein